MQSTGCSTVFSFQLFLGSRICHDLSMLCGVSFGMHWGMGVAPTQQPWEISKNSFEWFSRDLTEGRRFKRCFESNIQTEVCDDSMILYHELLWYDIISCILHHMIPPFTRAIQRSGAETSKRLTEARDALTADLMWCRSVFRWPMATLMATSHHQPICTELLQNTMGQQKTDRNCVLRDHSVTMANLLNHHSQVDPSGAFLSELLTCWLESGTTGNPVGA